MSDSISIEEFIEVPREELEELVNAIRDRGDVFSINVRETTVDNTGLRFLRYTGFCLIYPQQLEAEVNLDGDIQ